MKAKIAIIKDTGIFVKLDDEIAGVTKELVAIIKNLLFACEADICETVVANSINKAQEKKVLNFIREFA